MEDSRPAPTFFTGWTSTDAATDINMSNSTLDPYSPTLASAASSAMVPPTADGELSPEMAIKELKWVFVVHSYVFACLFFVLAFYTFFSILNLRSLTSNRSSMTTINVFVCVLGVARSFCLFIDPYLVHETLPKSFGTVVWDVGYPSVMAAFSFVQLAFLQLTQVHVGLACVRKKSFLSVVITGHLCCVVVSDVVAVFQDHLVAIKYAVQGVFLAWGLFLCCTFLYAGFKVRALLKLMPKHTLLGAQPGCSNKGIMQLAMLAPYTNLASCLTAALMPTLLGPGSGPDADPGPRALDARDPRPAGNQSGNSTPPTAPLDSVRPAASKWSPGCRRKTRSPSTPVATSLRRSSNPLGAAKSRRRSEMSSTSSHSVTFSMDLPQEQEQEQDHEQDQDQGQDEPAKTEGPPRSPRLTKPRTHFNSVTPQPKEPVANCKLQHTESSESCKSALLTEANHSVFAGAKTPLKNTASSDAEAKIELQPQRQPRTTDLTLDSILNHIAFVNRTSGQRQVSIESTEGKSQVRRVLRVTYGTAVLGFALCVFLLIEMALPTALLVSPTAWPWIVFQTVIRLVEFGMGCAMANITKQPANARYHQRPFGHPAHRREPHFL